MEQLTEPLATYLLMWEIFEDDLTKDVTIFDGLRDFAADHFGCKDRNAPYAMMFAAFCYGVHLTDDIINRKE